MARLMRAVAARRIDMPVEQSRSPTGQTGIAFAAINGTVVISIVDGTAGMCVHFSGEMVDYVAGLLADTVNEATAQCPPEARTVQ